MDFLSRRPWLISLLLVLLLGAWIASGSLQQQSAEPSATLASPAKRVRVQVREPQTASMQRTLSLYGRTEPNRTATLRAEVAGRIEATAAAEGTRVAAGDLLVSLAMNDLKERLEHAIALRAQRQLEYEGARALGAKGYQGEARIAEMEAALKESQALAANLKREIANTAVRAPFPGVLVERLVEVGDYVSIGDPIAQIADLDPLVVRGDASQQDALQLRADQRADARFTDGSSQQGALRYVASVADRETGTFRIELAIPNSDYRLPGGLSAEIQIPLSDVLAVRISPALLSLSEEGSIGVKWVRDGRVGFSPIDIVQSDDQGAWITGIPQDVRLITLGQGFVSSGDEVEAVPETPEG